MKYKGSIEINKPKAQVAALFASPDSLKEYQDGFVRKELLRGQEGKDGAVSKMYYEFGKQKMIMEETIVKNLLPDSFEAFYHHKHMDNTFKCTFTTIDANTTQYVYEYEYTRISWIMPRMMAILFPGEYRKQGDKWMQQFKEYVERQ